MKSLLALQFNAIDVMIDKNGNICLTDLWKLAGKNSQATPAKWQETESAKSFIKAVARILNIAKNDVIKTKQGKGGSTFAHKQIALEYAQYLDPELAVAVNNTFFERLDEQQNPELAVDRALHDWKKQGKDDEWIRTRLRSKSQRYEFTGTLKEHGVTNKGPEDNGYRACTNAIYSPLFGGDTNLIRQKKNLPQRSSIRDNLGPVELAAVMLSEAVAADNIKNKSLKGNKDCVNECKVVSSNVANAVFQSRKSQPRNIG
jgi:hypothetical protein